MSKNTHNNTCDECDEGIPEEANFCQLCGAEQGLISWDWRDSPPWFAINQVIERGPCQIESVEMHEEQHYIRIIEL